MTFEDFKETGIGDREIFEEHLKADPPRTSELTFTNLFIWRHKYRPLWRRVDGCLLVILRPEGEPPFGLPPIGAGDKGEALNLLVRYLKQETAEPRICRVGADLVKKDVDPGKFKIISDRDNADYVYLSRDLIRLSGRKYHRKKNHLNKFIKHHAFEYRPLDAALVQDFLEMQESWCRMRECVETPDLLSEDYAVHEALTHFESLDFQGGAILMDSKVEAFSLGEPLNQETAVIHIEKANPDIPGLYTAINQLFCENAWAGVTYINREQDLGVEGLRKAKTTYHPHHMVDKFILVPEFG